jgi:hypothetical protein
MPGIVAAAVIGGLVAAAGTTDVEAASTTRPMVFGAAATTPASITDHEKALGKTLEGARLFKKWDSTIIGSNELWMRAHGTTPYISIKAARVGGKSISFSSIASATPGSALYKDMQRMASQVKGYKSTVYIIFNHEPEASSSRKSGNGPQFAAAFRKFVTVFRAEGASNAKFVATFTGWGFTRHDAQNVSNYYPGDAYVDAVAADVYNWASCRGQQWTSLASLIESFRVWGKAHPSKPLMLMEWGSSEDKSQPGRKAAWVNAADALFKQPAYAQFTAIMQWGGRFTANSANCGFDYASSASAKAAWVHMGQDAAYRGAIR